MKPRRLPIPALFRLDRTLEFGSGLRQLRKAWADHKAATADTVRLAIQQLRKAVAA